MNEAAIGGSRRLIQPVKVSNGSLDKERTSTVRVCQTGLVLMVGDGGILEPQVWSFPLQVRILSVLEFPQFDPVAGSAFILPQPPAVAGWAFNGDGGSRGR
jgi:hypothetical protein